MPKVGSKHFSYTKKGKAAARRLAKKTGKKVTNKKKSVSKSKKREPARKQNTNAPARNTCR